MCQWETASGRLLSSAAIALIGSSRYTTVGSHGGSANTQGLAQIGCERHEAGLQPNTHQPTGCRAIAMPTMLSTTTIAAMKNSMR